METALGRPGVTVNRWRSYWEIIDDQVCCRTCSARQGLIEAGRPFVHYPFCTAKIPAAQLPWRDLASILRREVGKPSKGQAG